MIRQSTFLRGLKKKKRDGINMFMRESAKRRVNQQKKPKIQVSHFGLANSITGNLKDPQISLSFFGAREWGRDPKSWSERIFSNKPCFWLCCGNFGLGSCWRDYGRKR